MELPRHPSPEDWPSIRRGFGEWDLVMREICGRHRLPASELTPAPTGTNVVFTTADHVLKLYPPMWNDAAAGELAALGHVRGRLPLATPEVVAADRFDAWRYVVMTRLPGILLADVWMTLDQAAQCAIAAQLGEALRALHAVPVGPLADVAPLTTRWATRIERADDEVIAHHRRQGVGEPWLARLSVLLARRPPLHPHPFAPVLLHGDAHQWHLFAAGDGESWRLTALIDFDDALLGWKEYEFALPGVLMLAGNGPALTACLRAYGFAAGELNDGLRRRLMVYALLNRYWGLDVMLEGGDPTGRCNTLQELEGAIFPLGLD